MRVMRDFLCEEGHTTERFVDSSTEETTCSECGKPAFKQVNATRSYLEPFSGAFPGAYYDWNRKRLDKLKQEKKQKASSSEE